MNTPPTLTAIDSDLLLDALVSRDAPHKTFLKGIRNYLLGCLMLDAGLRVGEAVALEVSDLYYNGVPVTSIRVRTAITKSKNERSVPVTARLKKALEEYAQRDPADNFVWPSSYVFPRADNTKHITTRQVERIVNKAAWKVLGRPVNPHVLRHTFASRLMRVTNTRTVQELLGHEHLSSTQIYMHPNEQDKTKAITDMHNKSDPTHPDFESLA